ncbi:hypothetical protein ABGV40_14785 [Paenibacillus amylolyticus]
MVNKPTVQAPPERVDGKQHKSRKGLTIDVSIKDTEVFKNILDAIGKIVTDERMPIDLREDAVKWLYKAGASAATIISAREQRESIVILCETISLGKSMWNWRQHKYNPDAQLLFLGKDNRTMVDGLKPDKVLLLPGYQKSKGYGITWFKKNGELSQVIDETGDSNG